MRRQRHKRRSQRQQRQRSFYRSTSRFGGRRPRGHDTSRGILVPLLVATPALVLALWCVTNAPAVAAVVATMAAFATASVVVPYLVVRVVTALLERHEATGVDVSADRTHGPDENRSRDDRRGERERVKLRTVDLRNGRDE